MSRLEEHSVLVDERNEPRKPVDSAFQLNTQVVASLNKFVVCAMSLNSILNAKVVNGQHTRFEDGLAQLFGAFHEALCLYLGREAEMQRILHISFSSGTGEN